MALAGYWYRDDSLDLWDAVWKFVEEILWLYYVDDAAVAADTELNVMLSELSQHTTNTSLVRIVTSLRIRQFLSLRPPI